VAPVKLLTVDGHWAFHDDMPDRRPDIEAGLVFETRRRWLRLFATWGTAPGSHMMGQHLTAWYTDFGPGEVHGWNVRAGWWPGPCLTVLCHTRPARDVWAYAVMGA
jgi:hypothetical protein